MFNKILIIGIVIFALIALAGIIFGIVSSKKSSIKAIDLSTIKNECSKTPIAPSSGYTDLLTDVHVHLTQDRSEKQIQFAQQLLKEMNDQGVQRVAVQHNHNPNPDRSRNQMREVEELWGQISATCPRIITLLYAFNPDQPKDFQYVKDQLDTGNYGGVGELDFQHGSFTHLKHDPESETMKKIYELLEQKGLAVHFQAQLNVDPLLGDKIQRVVSSRPKLNFIWFGCQGEEKFLQLTNLYCNQFLHSQSRERRQEVLSRSIIGSDAGPADFWNPAYGFLPYQSFAEAMQQARQELAKQPTDVADQLAHGNFDRIWPKK